MLHDKEITILSNSFSFDCQLERLVLFENDIGTDGLSHLVSRLRFLKNLKSLHLMKNPGRFPLPIFQLLCDVVIRRKMTELHVHVSFDHLETLSLAVVNSNMKVLTLGGPVGVLVDFNLVSAQWQGFVAKLAECPELKLTSLCLYSFPYYSPLFVPLFEQLLPRLSRLEVSNNIGLNMNFGFVLAQMIENGSCQKLEYLNLFNCSLRQGVLDIIRALVHPNCRLKALDLRLNNSGISDSSRRMKEITSLLRSPACNLAHLRICEPESEEIIHTMKCVNVARCMIGLRSSREVTRWKTKSAIANLPKELCLLTCQFLI
jgi:hypothetical protein